MKNKHTLILVTGGRKFLDSGLAFDCITYLNQQFDNVIIIHGDAPGADSLANTICLEVGIDQVKVPAIWNKYNKAAGPIRNQLMLDLFPTIDLVLAFPGGVGTQDMCARATQKDIQVIYAEDLIQTIRQG